MKKSTNAEEVEGVIISDTVWMLVNKKTGALWYSPPASNNNDCWDNAVAWEHARGGLQTTDERWRDAMRKEGWAAKHVKCITNEAR